MRSYLEMLQQTWWIALLMTAAVWAIMWPIGTLIAWLILRGKSP